MSILENFLAIYLRERPLFLSLIRAKEAELYQQYLPMKKPVLDVGCGDGFFAKIALSSKRVNRRVRPLRYSRSDPGQDSGQIAVGLDMPNSRIKEAKKAGVYKRLVTYDGQSFPFKDHSFATVVSNSVLEHVPNLEEVVGEIHRVLKPGGIFLTTVMTDKWEDYLFGAKILGNKYKHWMREKQVHEHLLSFSQWQRLFERRGFTVEACSGYLSPLACQLIDIGHYISLPNLVFYKLFHKWVLFPVFTHHIYSNKVLIAILDEKISLPHAGGIFYALIRD